MQGMSQPPRFQGARGYVPKTMLSLGRLRALSAEAAEYLGEVVRDSEIDTKHRVSAGRGLLAHHQWREDWEDKRSPETLFLAMFGNDPAKAAAWLDANEGRIRARLSSANVTTSAAEESEDHGPEAEQGHEGEGDERREQR